MIKFEDSLIDFNKNSNGYYRVGKKFFYKKYNAAVESAITSYPISWDFHRTVFESAIAKPELNLNLLDWYKIRALQLRDSYDYLILAYSGGSDSDNILQTFLKNDIKLDEIWSDFPKSLIEKSNYVLTNSTDPSNMAAEMYTVVIPELAEVSRKYPNIKIHFSDTWENRSIEDYEDTYSFVSIPSTYVFIQRYRYILNYAKKLIEEGKKVAIIQGIDKPVPHIRDNTYGMIFSDKATTYKSEIIEDVYVPLEYFYWSTALPELAVAQAKTLWNVILSNKLENQVRTLYNSSNTANLLDRQNGLDYLIKKICFPYWNFSKLQVNKSSHLFNKNYLHFLEKHSSDITYQSYTSSLNNLKKLPALAENGILGQYTYNYCFFPLGQL